MVAMLVLAVLSTSQNLLEYQFSSIDNGTLETVQCQVGDRISITLDENQTTGYSWMIPEEREGFNEIWTLVGDTSESNPSNGMVGVGGTHTFTIQVNEAGVEHFTLVYGRPWLYDNAIDEYYRTGSFSAAIMEGTAIQLRIDASE